MKFTVKLADKIIQMDSIYEGLPKYCKDYIVEDATPDYCLSWTEDEIITEENYSETKGFSKAYLETLTALRKISEIFPSCNRFLMHGASIAYDDKAYLFTAPSGTGKSTHINLWHQYLGDHVHIVNGDKPFISIENEQVRIYGTPWAGKEHWQRNCSAPLNGICFLKRGTENKIRRMDPIECLPLVFNQLYLPADPTAAGLTLELLDALLKYVPVYVLECDISEDAVRCSFEALTGLKYPNK